MASLLGAKLLETGLRTYFFCPFAEEGAFHIEIEIYFRLMENYFINLIYSKIRI